MNPFLAACVAAAKSKPADPVAPAAVAANAAVREAQPTVRQPKTEPAVVKTEAVAPQATSTKLPSARKFVPRSTGLPQLLAQRCADSLVPGPKEGSVRTAPCSGASGAQWHPMTSAPGVTVEDGELPGARKQGEGSPLPPTEPVHQRKLESYLEDAAVAWASRDRGKAGKGKSKGKTKGKGDRKGKGKGSAKGKDDRSSKGEGKRRGERKGGAEGKGNAKGKGKSTQLHVDNGEMNAAPRLAIPGIFKTKLCIAYKHGSCHNGQHCRYAHGSGELRKRDQSAVEALQAGEYDFKTLEKKVSKQEKRKRAEDQQQTTEQTPVESKPDDFSPLFGSLKAVPAIGLFSLHTGAFSDPVESPVAQPSAPPKHSPAAKSSEPQDQSRKRARAESAPARARPPPPRSKGKGKGKGSSKGKEERRPLSICKYFSMGICEKGDACEFAHEGPQGKIRETCRYWLSGSCLKGADCTFSHDASFLPCKSMVISGTCAGGESCKFSHDALDESERAKLIAKFKLEDEERQARKAMKNDAVMAPVNANAHLMYAHKSELTLWNVSWILNKRTVAAGDPLSPRGNFGKHRPVAPPRVTKQAATEVTQMPPSISQPNQDGAIKVVEALPSMSSRSNLATTEAEALPSMSPRNKVAVTEVEALPSLLRTSSSLE